MSAVIVPSIVIMMLFIAAVAAQLWINRAELAQPIARIQQNGVLLYELPLSGEVDIKLNGNIVRIQNGKIGVVQADCADMVCMKMGFIGGGLPIICLPNRLEVRIVENKTGLSDIDGITG
ncbi:MAG: NusG domain II-containing protein [Oscillospiraceae bacterium]|nr:NusG domain II-containing protein [Oscillospiraceae bacterium]